MTVLLSEIIVIVIALLYCFFGYRLARLLLPLPAAAFGLWLLMLLLPEYFSFEGTNQIIVSVSFIVFMYAALFMLKRVAALITGIFTAALVCIAAVSLSNITMFEIAAPIMLTVCITAGLLCLVYIRKGVIIATSVLGGFVVSFFGLAVIAGGFKTLSIKAAAEFFSANALLICVVAVSLIAAGILLQMCISGKRTILPSPGERRLWPGAKTAGQSNARNSFI